MSSSAMIRDAFEKYGVVGPLEILSPTEAHEVLQEVLDWEQSLPENDTNDSSKSNTTEIHKRSSSSSSSSSNKRKLKISGNLRFKPHLFLPKLNRLVVRHDRLIQAVQDALQSENILLWSCDLNIKEPSTPMYFAPHQDATYTGLHPAAKCLTAWLALSDPVSELEGCLQFWKGSHRLGQVAHQERSHEVDPFNILSRGQRVSDTTAPSIIRDPVSSFITIPLRAGQATLHHFHTIHQSGPNRNPHLVRIGLACRYIDATVRHVPNSRLLRETMGDSNDDDNEEEVVGDAFVVRESVTWISGQVLHNGFDLEPILPEYPTEEQVEQGHQAHAIAMDREAANYFQGANVQTYDQRSSPKQPDQQ